MFAFSSEPITMYWKVATNYQHYMRAYYIRVTATNTQKKQFSRLCQTQLGQIQKCIKKFTDLSQIQKRSIQMSPVHWQVLPSCPFLPYPYCWRIYIRLPLYKFGIYVARISPPLLLPPRLTKEHHLPKS